ncbi:MAG: hypothetical protein ABEJ82_10410 [Haloplanus sp.]
MSDGPSRRRVLRAVGATSGLGLLGFAGTRAFVTDEETTHDLVESRGVDLDVGWRVTDGPIVSAAGEASAADDDAPFKPVSSDPSLTLTTAERKTLQFELRMTIPDLLALYARVQTAGEDYENQMAVRWDVAEGHAFSDPTSTTLREFVDGPFGEGRLLYDRCPHSSASSDAGWPVCLGLELLPTMEDVPLTFEPTFDFLVQQCKPVTDPATENPWQ